MRASSLGSWSIAALFAAASFAACSAANGNGHSTGSGVGGAGGSSTSTGVGNGGPGSTSSSSGSSLSGPVGSSSSGGPGVASAYAHTNTTLYKLDPSQATLAVTQIGDFDCIGGTGQDTSMTDLAVNETGDLWAVSKRNIYKLQLPAGGTGPVHCATTIPLKTASGVSFVGLTFAPAGVLDPNNEVLVASNTAGALYAVDTNGNLTQHGTFGTVPAMDGHNHNYMYPNTAWELSGDIVFLANNGNPIGFATVRDCQSPPTDYPCNPTDTLVEIDMTQLAIAGTQSVTKSIRGQVVKASGCNDTKNSSYGSMFGVAAYEDKVFGFSHQGSIVTIDNNDGTACLALSTPNETWAGAAITTVAPVIVPTTN